MKRDFSYLKNLHVPKPCHADWDAMTGDEQARHCKHCDKKVFNLTGLTAKQTDRLFSQHPDGLCIRYQTDHEGAPLFQPETRRRHLAQWCALALACSFPMTALASDPPNKASVKHTIVKKQKKVPATIHAGFVSPKRATATPKKVSALLGQVALPYKARPHTTMGVPVPVKPRNANLPVLAGKPVVPTRVVKGKPAVSVPSKPASRFDAPAMFLGEVTASPRNRLPRRNDPVSLPGEKNPNQH